ncbi:MAG TPA: hypothetical protein GX747_01825 [Tenericutes bacterium]|nr:hypothetical protein [Mycoplasmatota bacterium]
MKKNNSGFILAEAIIVSTLALTVLVVLYTQFNKINRNYNITFSYNSVENIYAANNFKMYLLKSGYDNLVSALESMPERYLDIKSCPIEYLSENSHCKNLVDVISAKNIFFTNADIMDLKKEIENKTEISFEMKEFIKSISRNVNDDQYRLIIEFNDGSFATILI